MNKEAKRGRPKRGTLSLDDVITRYLLTHGGLAEWKDLKKARAEAVISDSALADAINRLIKAKRIEVSAVLKGKEAIKLYRLPQPVPVLEIGGEHVPLLEWVGRSLRQLEAVRKTELEQMQLPSDDLNKFKGMSISPSPVAEVQSRVLAEAMQALVTQILDLIDSANSAEKEDETMMYLDAACRIYLSVLIKEISKLASWRYGSGSEAMKLVKEMLLGKEHK